MQSPYGKLSGSALENVPIGMVSKYTGLTTHTIRVWERRYTAISPKRDTGGRRLYTSAEIERLNLLGGLVDRGYAIGKIANLEDEALRDLPTRPGGDKTASSPGSSKDFKAQLRDAILESAEDYDMQRCSQAINAGIMNLSSEELIADVCSPVAREIGDRWSAGTLNVAQEHMVSSALKAYLLPQIVSSASKTAKNTPIVIFATPENERHELGILFCGYTAAAQGMRCYYLGPDMPAETLTEAAHDLKADVICLSLINRPHTARIEDYLQRLTEDLRPACGVWLGGIGAMNLRNMVVPDRVQIFDDDRTYHAALWRLKA